MSFTDNTTGRYEWETPPEFFESVNSEFNFTCDVCATPDKTKVPENFYTPEQNGLLQKWNGVCWMNPPYGRDISKWVAKAKRERERTGLPRFAFYRAVQTMLGGISTLWRRTRSGFCAVG